MSRPHRFPPARPLAFAGRRRRKRRRFELLEPRLPLDATALQITELNFHPHAPTAAELTAFPEFDDVDDFEFIELHNPTAEAIDLAGVEFTDGVTFAFGDGSLASLAAGHYAVVVGDTEAFLARYGNELAGVVAGEYTTGRLSDGGEQLTLVLTDGQTEETIVDFTYDTVTPWPAHADGHGRSMVAVDPAGDLSAPETWRSSTTPGGSPGAANAGPIATPTPTLALVELMYHPQDPTAGELILDPEVTDDGFEFIELVNTGNDPVDLTGIAVVGGVSFFFDDVAVDTLPPGERVVMVNDESAFASRYGVGAAATIAGEFNGQLSNNGERIALVDLAGVPFFEFTYSPEAEWPMHADGHGRSLVAIDPTADPTLPGNWRASTEMGGSPGGEGLGPIATPAPTLSVSEIMFAPHDPTAAELLGNPALTAEQFEFIELVNTGAAPADLAGVALVGGVSFFFDDVALDTLAPGERVVLVGDEIEFPTRYGGAPVTGEFNGQLSNNGERIALVDLAGQPFFEFTYSVGDGWPMHADGHGRSMVAIDPAGDLNFPDAWRASSEVDGSPGVEDADPVTTPPPALTVSEILFPPHDPTAEELAVNPAFTAEQFEFIELANTGGTPIDLSGIALVDGVSFFFDDVALDTLASGEHVVLAADLDAFSARYDAPAVATVAGEFDGQLRNSGERLALVDLSGQPFAEFTYLLGQTWPIHAESAGRSLERIDPPGDPALPENWRAAPRYGGSPGVAFTGPVPTPALAITEIMFHPYEPTGAELAADATLTDDRFEFIEMRNVGGTTIDLTDAALVDGVAFAFADGAKTSLDAGQFVLLVGDPDAFRLRYGNGLDDLIAGQFIGALNDGGDRLLLIDRATRLVIADVFYQTGEPWPAEVEGRGRSLEAIDPTADLNLPESWRAGTEYGGSPGTEGIGPLEPMPLAITEIMFAPHDPTEVELAADPALTGESFQFIELVNTGDSPIDLADVSFAGSLEFAFVDGTKTSLAAGEFVLIVRDPAAFRVRYGTGLDAAIAGSFTGVLDTGIAMLLLGEHNGVLASFDVDADASWLNRADGDGSSLERVDPDVDPDRPAAWQASPLLGGSPGTESPDVLPPRVAINEVLANSNDLAGELDWIELLNISGGPVDLSGWRLNDNLGMNGDSFHVPAGVVLAPGEYVVFDETEFNPNGDGTDGFALRSTGETLFLFATEQDVAVRFEDRVEFGATVESISTGRILNGTGDFFPLAHPSPGDENGSFYLSDVVISEIMYHTWQDASGEDRPMEFIELLNRSDAPVDLTAWAIGGDDARLPDIPPLAPGQTVVLVAFGPLDPVAGLYEDLFRMTYDIGPEVPLYGPFVGALSNGGERIELLRPDRSDTPGEHNMIPVDSVTYDDKAPWPAEADGSPIPAEVGFSLNRIGPDAFADHFHSWAGAAPTPGTYAPTPAVSALDGLIVSELMYNPPGADPEFIELFNPTGFEMDVSGAELSLGVDFTFPQDTVVAAGGRIIVVPFNPDLDPVTYANFLVTHGMAGKPFTVVGPYARRFDDNGESILLTDAEGRFVFSMDYVGGGRFPREAAGQGASLQLRAEAGVPDEPTMRYLHLSNGASWVAVDPTPGEAVETTPPAARDDQAIVEGGTPSAIDFLDNDTPGTLPINVASVVVTVDVAHGTLEVSPIDGTAVYQSEAGYVGDDEFRYMVLDLDGTPSGEAVVAISVEAAAPPWQNPEHKRDVNDDEHIVPLDILLIINELNRHGPRELSAPDGETAPPPYYDVNGDGHISPIDALQVINYLNTYGPGATGLHPEAEPAPAVLAPASGQAGTSSGEAARPIASASTTQQAIDAVHARDQRPAWNTPWWQMQRRWGQTVSSR